MPNYMVNDVSLTSVANAIRVKGGTSSPLVFPDGFVTAIENISGGGGDDYIRTVVCPQQNFTVPSGSTYVMLSNAERLIAGDDYIVTYDGTEYICTSTQLWGSDRFIGDLVITWGSYSSDYIFPFCVEDWNSNPGPAVYARDNSQHSIKIEHLELLTTGTTLVSKTITANGTYDPSNDNADGYSEVTVSIPSGTAGTPTATKGAVNNHSITVTPSVTNTTGYITGGTKTGTGVTVSASELVSGTMTILENMTGLDVTNYATVDVDVRLSPAIYQNKTGIDPSEASQTITADAGFDALASVQINRIPESYVGSGITRRSSSDLTASGATVTAPAGYYGAAATKTVASGSATVPASISGTSATVSTGTNTLTLSKTVSVTPSVTAGYVSSGTAANSSVSLTASVTTQAAQTIHPSTTDQSIAASRYLTGAQTIKAVTMSNLTAANIKKDVVVKIGDSTDDDCVTSITGTYEGGGSSKNVQVAQSTTRIASTSYTKTASLTCAVTGKYDIYWDCFRSSTSGTSGSQLYIGGSAYGSANTTFSNHAQNNHLTNVNLTANQEVAVYVRSRNTSNYAYCGQLTIVQTA